MLLVLDYRVSRKGPGSFGLQDQLALHDTRRNPHPVIVV